MFKNMFMCLIVVLFFANISYSDEKTKKITSKSKISSKTTTKKAAKDYIDKMEETTGWNIYNDQGAVAKISTTMGKVGKALQIDYDFTKGAWIAIYKDTVRDLSDVKAIKFVYRGEGNKNTLEVKLEDADGSNFGTYVKTKSNPDKWTIVEIPITELQYWWSGDNQLDLKTAKLHFGISVKEDMGDEKGTGKVIIDEVEAIK